MYISCIDTNSADPNQLAAHVGNETATPNEQACSKEYVF